MKASQEHEFEAAPGLPEALPAGEHIVWQGAPNAHVLAMQVYHVRALAAYFVAMLVLQALFLLGEPNGFTFKPLLISSVLALVSLALLYVIAGYSARNTLYTLTNKRVVMRVGIVLTFTLNLPYRQISTASVRHYRDGFGDIALDLSGDNRIGWLHLWPHARPWTINKPQPSLRCLANADQVAEALQAAWCDANPSALVRLGDVSEGSTAGRAVGSDHGAVAT